MIKFLQRCINEGCRGEFGIEERVYVCPRCGELLEIVTADLHGSVGAEEVRPQELKDVWRQRRMSMDVRDRSGVWRFREFLPFPDEVEVVSLCEGNTQVYEAPRCAEYCGLESLLLKHQGNNPTGSFKDTGMTVAVTQAKKLGVSEVVCASTGNTAASLAAYAARASLKCAIMVPAGQVSNAKLAQALDYGAEVRKIEGNFDDCMRAIREVSESGDAYLVNSINPFRIEGQKTVAFELAEQLEWRMPDHLVVPGGNLGNSSAFGKGIRELMAAGLIDRQPRITVVQAEGAAPFARFYREHGSELVNEENPQTLATAVKIGAPVSWKKAWNAVRDSDGQVLTVSEQEIADAKAMIGRDGIGCEPASATTVAGIRRMVSDGVMKKHESVVAVLTGHLLKDTDYVIKYHDQKLVAPDGTRIKSIDEREFV